MSEQKWVIEFRDGSPKEILPGTYKYDMRDGDVFFFGDLSKGDGDRLIVYARGVWARFYLADVGMGR